MYDQHHKQRFTHRMVAEYGGEEVESLERKSRGLAKLFRFEVEDLIEYYRSENRLKK